MAKVDAVFLPPHYGKGSTLDSKLNAINAEFLPILGCKRLYVRQQGANAGSFVSGNPNDPLNFPTDHERMGEPRYEWTDRGDGVRYGTLVPDPPVAEPAPDAAVGVVPEVPHVG
jgi:hypothetical protein